MAVWGYVLSRQSRVGRTCLAVVLAVALGSIPIWGQEGLAWSHCLFREFTGKSCPTCGLTRSLRAASHGHLEAAFQFHLLGPFVLAGMLLLALVCVAEASAGKRLVWFQDVRRQRYVFLAVVMIWIVYGVGRVIAELM